jgi:hypothetical protein
MSMEPRAWLVVRGEDREPMAVEMEPGRRGFWFAVVELPEGIYRCRYYHGDDRHAIYCGPAHAGGNIEDGLDAVVAVDVPQEPWSVGDNVLDGGRLSGIDQRPWR